MRLGGSIDSILSTVDSGSITSAERGARAIREVMRKTEIPANVVRSIKEAYDRLTKNAGAGEGSLPVAVRSSATAEDLPNASLAGQHETYLWVKGGDQVVHHVRECWASAFAARSLQYRKFKGIDNSGVEMGVVVQRMLNPAKSGVMFTLNPANGDPSKISIDSSWGLGESIVSGSVTPDLYVVDKVTLEILTRRVSRKLRERVVLADRVTERDVPKERQETSSLNDEEVIELAKMGKGIEKLFGKSQDIEWALEASPDPRRGLFILQARPETVWSKKKNAKTSSRAALDLIVDTLTRTRKIG